MKTVARISPGSTGCDHLVPGSLPGTWARQPKDMAAPFQSAIYNRAAGRLPAANGLAARAPRRNP